MGSKAGRVRGCEVGVGGESNAGADAERGISPPRVFRAAARAISLAPGEYISQPQR